MLQLHHLPCAALGAPPPAGEWLGAACFGAAGMPGALPADLPFARVQVQPLAAAPTPLQAPCEAWAVAGPVHAGRHGALQWRCNDAWWFGTLQLDEVVAPDGIAALQQAAQRAYALLFETMDAQGFEHLVRVWNHVADITAERDGLERYRQFNIGRQDAFVAHGRSVAGASVPAASALGARSGAPLLLYALAARRPPRALENPRQVSAYHYPSEYGPRSPTFSRAAVAHTDTQPVLFISGTASVVGHRSLHEGDAVAQTQETLRNLQAVLDQAGQMEATRWQLPQLHYKVYVRHPADWPQIHAELRRAVGERAPVLALQADVCRSNLLVEIEAAGTAAA